MKKQNGTTCMGYPVSVFKRANRLYDKTALHDDRIFWQLAGYERDLWVNAMKEIEQEKKARRFKFPFESDKIRKDLLAKPTYTVSPDIDFNPSLASFNPEDWFCIVVKMPSAIFFYERWLPDCKMAFKRKYGTTKVSMIMAVMPERMKAIGDSLGLKMESFEWDRGVAKTKYTAKPPKHRRVQVYNPKGRCWVLVDTDKGKIIGKKDKMYKKTPIAISSEWS